MKNIRCEKKIYCRYVKRTLDIIFSFLLLLFLSMPMFIIAVAIRSESSGKAIFSQKRLGRDGRVFVCYKFRTMYITAPHAMPASEFKDKKVYITRIGGFLRRSSLDELPQLFNVLKGDMSIIGPRPLICEEEKIHRRRMECGVYSLRPGITGMAQVSGRNLLCDDDKLRGDMYYLENIRLLLDIKILLRTFFKVVKGEGIVSRANGERKV